MAERRMFAKTIIDSDAFIDMPLSTQALYFHLSMRADDDGFINNAKKIQRMIGAADDDLKMLAVKRFIIPFESGIVVIKHWKIHNYIRGDRKKDTVYPEEMGMLMEKENGSYSLRSEEPVLIEAPSHETPRQKAYRESSLPYSFEYKIRQAFYGEICPVCGFAMKGTVDEAGVGTNARRPSIQHNIPISKGGKHELGNISVICHKCNVTLQDTETGPLNADEVIRKWDEICTARKCPSSDGQVTDKCQHRLGEVRLVQGSLVEESIEDGGGSPPPNPPTPPDPPKRAVFIKPTLDEVRAYCQERGKGVNAERWYNHYEANGWMVGRTKMKDWKAAVRTWEPDEKPKSKGGNVFLEIAQEEGIV